MARRTVRHLRNLWAAGSLATGGLVRRNCGNCLGMHPAFEARYSLATVQCQRAGKRAYSETGGSPSGLADHSCSNRPGTRRRLARSDSLETAHQGQNRMIDFAHLVTDLTAVVTGTPVRTLSRLM